MPASLGKFYDQAALGRCFIGNTAAAGVAIPVETGTAVTFALWNTSIDKWAVPLFFSMAYLSGTVTIGGYGLANQLVGPVIGTPLTAFTDATPKNAILGLGNASSMRFTGSTATLAAGGTRCYQFGEAAQVATIVGGIQKITHDFDGKLIVPPGQLIFVTQTLVTTALYNMSMMWAEVAKQ